MTAAAPAAGTSPVGEERHASWLELFFDLVVVAGIGMLAHLLQEDHDRGGLALYASDGTLLGGLGLSGDSSVADHVIAWKLRKKLGLDFVPAGVSPTKDDNMVLDISNGKSAGGWGHPETTPEATKIVNELPETHPISKKK